jgi:hypothetical protein
VGLWFHFPTLGDIVTRRAIVHVIETDNFIHDPEVSMPRELTDLLLELA